MGAAIGNVFYDNLSNYVETEHKALNYKRNVYDWC